MKIKFGDLRIDSRTKDKIIKLIDSNWITQGSITSEFEDTFAMMFNHKYGIATGSGTDACIASLVSLQSFGCKFGNEVIIPANTFVATANSVIAAGYKPVFVDVDIDTLNINPNLIRDKITKNTVAIMPVHLMGKPCDMDVINKIARSHDLYVIEDCCEAHGAKYKGTYVGNLGDMGCFSFYVAHIIVSGEGGMVVTNKKKFNDVVRSVITHGRPFGSVYFDFQRYGLNLRTTDINSTIGLGELGKFKENYQKRVSNMELLKDLLYDLQDHFMFINPEPHEEISPHAFPIVLKDEKLNRNRLINYLNKSEIECKTLFGCLPTQHKVYAYLRQRVGEYPSAEYIGNNGLHFGIHQYLSENDIHYISKTLHYYVRTYGK